MRRMSKRQDEFECRLKEASDRLVEETKKKTNEVKMRKEKLRVALVKAGYDIPEGLTLEEWIPYIERGVRA